MRAATVWYIHINYQYHCCNKLTSGQYWQLHALAASWGGDWGLSPSLKVTVQYTCISLEKNCRIPITKFAYGSIPILVSRPGLSHKNEIMDRWERNNQGPGALPREIKELSRLLRLWGYTQKLGTFFSLQTSKGWSNCQQVMEASCGVVVDQIRVDSQRPCMERRCQTPWRSSLCDNDDDELVCGVNLYMLAFRSDVVCLRACVDSVDWLRSCSVRCW